MRKVKRQILWCNDVLFLQVRDYRTPLYKHKKKYPYYGRKKRDSDRILKRVPREAGWVLLDPATGRPVE